MLQCSECACLHKTVKMLVFFVKSNKNTYPKGRALMQMYRVVHQTKRENSICRHETAASDRFTLFNVHVPIS